MKDKPGMFHTWGELFWFMFCVVVVFFAARVVWNMM